MLRVAYVRHALNEHAENIKLNGFKVEKLLNPSSSLSTMNTINAKTFTCCGIKFRYLPEVDKLEALPKTSI